MKKPKTLLVFGCVTLLAFCTSLQSGSGPATPKPKARVDTVGVTWGGTASGNGGWVPLLFYVKYQIGEAASEEEWVEFEMESGDDGLTAAVLLKNRWNRAHPLRRCSATRNGSIVEFSNGSNINIQELSVSDNGGKSWQVLDSTATTVAGELTAKRSS